MERVTGLDLCETVKPRGSFLANRQYLQGKTLKKPSSSPIGHAQTKTEIYSAKKWLLFRGGEIVKKNGASEGIRTLDTHVGNVMLYQAELRSLPNKRGKTTGIPLECKSCSEEIRRRHKAVLARACASTSVLP